jgi:hypothetical protein
MFTGMLSPARTLLTSAVVEMETSGLWIASSASSTSEHATSGLLAQTRLTNDLATNVRMDMILLSASRRHLGA